VGYSRAGLNLCIGGKQQALKGINWFGFEVRSRIVRLMYSVIMRICHVVSESRMHRAERANGF